MKYFSTILFLIISCTGICQGKPLLKEDVYLIPNFHPSSCGWLTTFSTERNYCANTYFAHLSKVDHDSNYNFVISEVNNMIAMQNFQPERFEELKKRIWEGRIEAEFTCRTSAYNKFPGGRNRIFERKRVVFITRTATTNSDLKT